MNWLILTQNPKLRVIVPFGANGKVWTADSKAACGASWQDAPSGPGGGPHAGNHATGGSDPITPAAIGAATSDDLVALAVAAADADAGVAGDAAAALAVHAASAAHVHVGTATLDFGAFPGSSDAVVTVTGQTGIVSGSVVQAWVRPVATADHTADEHMVESLRVVAGANVAGVGFTIYGFNDNQINEPVREQPREQVRGASGQEASTGVDQGGRGTRLYGQFTIAWQWA